MYFDQKKTCIWYIERNAWVLWPAFKKDVYDMEQLISKYTFFYLLGPCVALVIKKKVK